MLKRELFDLKEDPTQIYNVYDDPACSDVVFRLKKELPGKKAFYAGRDSDNPEMKPSIEAQFRRENEMKKLDP